MPLVEVGRAAPRLVTRADLLGALHNHTNASDGSATLEQMRPYLRPIRPPVETPRDAP